MKKSLFASSLVLTVFSAISIVVTVLLIMANEAVELPQYVWSLLVFIFVGQLWWIIALMAGVLGLISLKRPKVRSAAAVLGLLFAVRMVVELVSYLIYGLIDLDALGALLRVAIAVWFVVSALKAE